jgi:hypothetical protein
VFSQGASNSVTTKEIYEPWIFTQTLPIRKQGL